jgi:L-aminopeptidase/D-esterase-like protein
LVAVNPFGSPIMPGSDAFWAWDTEVGAEFGGRRPPEGWRTPSMEFPTDTKLSGNAPGANTTIGVVATNAALTPAEAKRLAMMAQDGYARSVRPIHTLFDGDTVYALATGNKGIPEPRALLVSRLGHLAANCVARAVTRGVYEAETLGEMRSYREVFGV